MAIPSPKTNPSFTFKKFQSIEQDRNVSLIYMFVSYCSWLITIQLCHSIRIQQVGDVELSEFVICALWGRFQ
jgi:hypothetical protein